MDESNHHSDRFKSKAVDLKSTRTSVLRVERALRRSRHEPANGLGGAPSSTGSTRSRICSRKLSYSGRLSASRTENWATDCQLAISSLPSIRYLRLIMNGKWILGDRGLAGLK